MHLSQKNINQNLHKEILNVFFQLVADLKNPEEAKLVFENILGETELEAVAKRLAVAHYLEKGRSYSNIKNNLGVSSATIASVDKDRKSPGYQLALKKIEADRWANEWTNKIEGLFKRK